MVEKADNLNFFTPVQYEKPSSFEEAFRQRVDNYFYLGGRKAVVLSSKDKTVELKNIPTPLLKKVFFGVLKVVSYLTVIMPLVMLGLKMALRWNTQFHTVKVLQGTTSTPKAGDIFVFGDVHGELEGFQENLAHAGLIDPRTKHWCGGKALAIQMGDVFDRGPLSKEAYELLETIQEEAPKVGGQVVRLIGNHELMFLQKDFSYANVPNPQEIAEQIKEDIKHKKVQLAYTDGTRLFVHGGTRSAIEAIISKEIGVAPEGPISPKYLKRIVDHLNKILINAVINNDYGHPIFWVGVSRGGDKPIGGPLWEDEKEILQSAHARDIPQVIAHRPPGPGESPIRITDSMRLICVDAGLCKHYGGQQAYVKIGNGEVTTFQKVANVWGKIVQEDKLQQKQK